MKKNLILSMLVSFAMICSCQKQDSTAEQELAQRKTELDAREDALDERMNALDEKVKALDERVKVLAENQKAMANAGTSLSGVQAQTSDPAQVQAEREAAIQQLAAEIRARIPDDSKMKAERERERQRGLEKLQSQRQRAPEQLESQKQRKSQMFSGAVFPSPEAALPNSSPEGAATSPTPSPTPE